MAMLDVRRLRLLAELDRLGTLAAVAGELHMTASGVSMQLAALERQVGVPLTEKRGRRLALTPAGVLLARHGKDVVQRLSLAELEVDALRRGAVGRYAVAAFPSAARTFVADVWGRLMSESLEMTLVTREPEAALDDLATGRADLAVIHSYSNVPRDLPAGIEARPVVEEPVWLACRADDRAYDASPTAGLGSFADHDWLAPTVDLTCYAMLERACGLAGFRPRVVATSDDFAVHLALVADGVGVALVPGLAVPAVPRDVVLRRTNPAVTRRVLLAFRAGALADPGIAALGERLTTAARSVVARGIPSGTVDPRRPGPAGG